MSKVILKVEIDEKEYKALIGQEVFDIWRGNTLLKTIFKAIKTATPTTESDDCVSREDLDEAISALTYWHFDLNGRLVVGGCNDKTVYKVDDVTRLPKVLPPVIPKRE